VTMIGYTMMREPAERPAPACYFLVAGGIRLSSIDEGTLFELFHHGYEPERASRRLRVRLDDTSAPFPPRPRPRLMSRSRPWRTRPGVGCSSFCAWC
jgi:hypothetical protein